MAVSYWYVWNLWCKNSSFCSPLFCLAEYPVFHSRHHVMGFCSIKQQRSPFLCEVQWTPVMKWTKKMLKTINRIKSNEVKWNTFLQMFALFCTFSPVYFTLRFLFLNFCETKSKRKNRRNQSKKRRNRELTTVKQKSRKKRIALKCKEKRQIQRSYTILLVIIANIIIIMIVSGRKKWMAYNYTKWIFVHLASQSVCRSQQLGKDRPWRNKQGWMWSPITPYIWDFVWRLNKL